MKNKYFVILAISILTLHMACNRDKQVTGPTVITQDNVMVTVGDQEIEVSNQTGDAIYYAVFPESILPLIYWAPCIDPGTCENRIPNDRQVSLSIAEILNSIEDDTLVFYWWHLIEQGDGTYNFDTINNIKIKLVR